MKKLFSLLVLISVMSVNAQFKISGEIQNFNEKSLLVRINQGPNNKIVNKITTIKMENLRSIFPKNTTV